MPGWLDCALLMPANRLPPPPRIGVFDSGLGGLSVLRAVRRRCPRHTLLYVADSGHAPYGERGDEHVLRRSDAIADFLLAERADVLVVACNTATAAAIAHLRERLPGRSIVGVEPGIKPAATASRNGRIGVMATTGTLRSEKFRLLAQAHGAHVQLVLQPCPGLAGAIEGGDPESDEVVERVRQCCAPLRQAAVDTVVLGCTHYPFVAHHIERTLGPTVQLIDTSEAVARRVEALCPPVEGALPPGPARLWTTGARATLAGFARRWLDFDVEIETAVPA